MSRRRSLQGTSTTARRAVVAAAVGAALLLGGPPGPALAAGVRSASAAAGDRDVAALGAAWVRSQQQPDGGFEVAGFPGFETPDAVLALAAAAQTGSEWSARQGLSALLAQRSKDGRTPLDDIDDLADGAGGNAAPSAGAAAKLIALVAAPLCLDARRFDPSADGATDLWAIVEGAAQPDGTFGAFNATLYAAMAYEASGRSVPPATLAAIRAGQQSNGGWNFDGDPSRGDVDPDTTGLAVEVIAGTGATADDATVSRALAFLASSQDAGGGWANPSSFSDVNPNSAALASLAVVASGLDPAVRDWRDRFAPSRAGESYTSPYDYFASQQTADGRIASPNDQYGINTFATTQAIQALRRRTLPALPARGTCPSSGYRMFAADGGVFDFGQATFAGSLGGARLNSPIVAGASTPTGGGYLLFASDGGVFSFGDAAFEGSLGDRSLNKPIVAGAVTPSGKGYVLFASDGGVFSFGDAAFEGSVGDRPLHSPIVAGDVTPSGAGYLMFAADGGVFSFGDAPFLGSLGDARLNRPIVGGGRSSTGRGYAMFASDGGAFTFGDVSFAGSAATEPLVSPVVAGHVL